MKKQLPPFAKLFFQGKPEVLAAIEALEARRALRLSRRLMGDMDEINFYSWLSEMRTGLYLDGRTDELYYDKRLSGKTPDWLIRTNGQEVVVEVLRFNPDEAETRANIAENLHIHALHAANPGIRLLHRSTPKILSSAYFYGMQSKVELKITKYQMLI